MNNHKPEIIHYSTANTKPDISIICTCFNHELYIAEAIDSFLAQKTSYNFEIILHDDASSDDTSKILKDYYHRFPDKITLILQQTNQFSQGHFKAFIYTSAFAKADTIMLCDGDDYWTSNTKMERQFSRFNCFPNVELSFHPARKLIGANLSSIICQYSEDEYVFTAQQVIKGTGGFCPTGSLLLNKSVINNMSQELIDTMPIADAFIQACGAMKAGALFLPNADCVYRINSSSSFMSALSESSKAKRKEFMLRMSEAYKVLRKNSSIWFKLSLLKMEKKYKKKARRIK